MGRSPPGRRMRGDRPLAAFIALCSLPRSQNRPAKFLAQLANLLPSLTCLLNDFTDSECKNKNIKIVVLSVQRQEYQRAPLGLALAMQVHVLNKSN